MENSNTTLNDAATAAAKQGATVGFVWFVTVGLGVFLYLFSPTFWQQAKKWNRDLRANRAAKKAAKEATKEAAASVC